MTDQRRKRILYLWDFGFRPDAIADQLGISTRQVREAIRIGGAKKLRNPPDPPNVAAAKELLAEGFSREAVVKVFGEVV